MKRLMILFIVLFSQIIANPIDDSPTIFEIQIIEPDNWVLEINMYDFLFEEIDSLFLEGLYGKARIISSDTVETERGYLLIVTQENMSEELQFSLESDNIRLHVYWSFLNNYTKQLIIGNYPSSYLHNITSSQSIVYDMYESTYYKSSMPSIGEYENHGCSAKIHGRFFDKDGSQIIDKYFRIYPGDFLTPSSEYIDSSGLYSANLGSKYYAYDSFYIWHPNAGGDTWHFNAVEFDLEPGDSLQVDFYASQTSIRPVIQNTIKFNNYPHPASSYTWFFIDNTEVEASAMRVNVFALNGRKVDSFIPTARQFRYDCAHLPQGSYVMSLQHGNEVLATKKLQILK